MKTLSIIIPIFNEQDTIVELLSKVCNADSAGYTKQLIIVNDGSTDRSDELIQHYSIKNHTVDIQYLALDSNIGKGGCIKKALPYVKGEYMIIQDADLEYEPADYAKILVYADKIHADIVYGSRIRGHIKYGLRYSSVEFLIGGLLISFMTSLLTLRLVTDEPTCYKLFSARLKKYLTIPEENGFEREPAVTMLLLKKQYTYGEVPIRYYPRNIQQGKKIRFSDGWIALKTLWKWRWKNV